MKKQRSYWLVWSIIPIIALLATIHPSAIAAEIPTPALIAAALRNQESSCGSSLEIVYSTTDAADNNKMEEMFKIRYIRTPGVLYVQEDHAGSTTRCFFDRSKSEYRKLADGYGLISRRLGRPFTIQSFVETSRYPLFDGALCDIIANGVVSEEQEDVDGHKCWRVNVPTTRQALEGYTVWVDPEIAFCPRRIEFAWKTLPPEIISFRQYKDIGNGVWFPMEHIVDAHTKSNATIRVISNIDQVHIRGEFTKDELTFVFPSGTKVHDEILDEHYVVP